MVFDGNLNTRFEINNDTGWVGLDLGATNTKVSTTLRYSPRNSSTGNLTNADFMIGGLFQVSPTADFSSGVVTLFTIPIAPTYSKLTSVALPPSQTPYRYVRYRTGAGKNANISELEIYVEQPLDGYAQWLVGIGKTPGAPGSAFDQESDGSGIANGVRYMVPAGVKIESASGSSKLVAVVRQDALVTIQLWKATTLGDWTSVTLSAAANQSDGASGFVRMEASVAMLPGQPAGFYRMSFSR